MRLPAFVGYTLTAAVMLAGCSGGGLQGPAANAPGAPGSGGSQSSQGGSIAARTITARHGVIPSSHMRIPNMAGPAAVYVSDAANNALFGYALTGGSPTYTVSTGLSEPQGLASTTTSVYVANTADSQILAFTPPSTTPTTTISDAGEYPAGVAVNAAGSQIWVSNICSAPSCTEGNLQEYKPSGALLKTITCSDLYRYYFVGIDANGDVAVDGEDTSGTPHVDFVPAGSSTCTPLTSIALEFPGGVEFTTTGDLSIDDQDANTVTTWTAPNFTSSSSTTSLSGVSDPVTFAFGQADANLWTANAGSANATQFAYPAGGSPTVTITSGLAEPIGVAVSGKTKGTKGKGKPPEIFNWWVQDPPASGPAPTDFEVVFTGNVTSDIPALLLSTGYDPFCPTSQTCSYTTTFNPTTDTTTVTYSGTTLYQNIPGHTDQSHFGLIAGDGDSTNIKCLAQDGFWTFPSAGAQPVPEVALNPRNCPPPGISGHNLSPDVAYTNYAYVYLDASFQPSGPPTWGVWFALPYKASARKQPKFAFSNEGQSTVYVLHSGIILDQALPSEACQLNPICPANVQLLESLNYAQLPPPGYASSPFTKMEFPPPASLPPSPR